MSTDASLAREVLQAAWRAPDGLADMLQSRLGRAVMLHAGGGPAFVAPARGGCTWYEPLPPEPPNALRYFSPIALADSFVAAVLARLGPAPSGAYQFGEFGVSGQGGRAFRVFRNRDGALNVVAPQLPPQWTEKEARHLLSLDEWTLGVTGLAHA